MNYTKSSALEAALSAFPMKQILDCLPDAVFFVKDSEGRYADVNDALVMRCGVKHKSDLIGKKPSEVMGALLGGSYEKQDHDIMKTGIQIKDQLELHIYANRRIGWCITNKQPLIGADGSIVGIIGISQDLRQPDISHEDYLKLSNITAYVKENLSSPPTLEDLCDLTSSSPYQLNSRIQKIYGLTTGQWILKQRIEYARDQLISTNTPLIEIALEAGYSDQSTFSRQFRKITGLSPMQFRKSGRVKV